MIKFVYVPGVELSELVSVLCCFQVHRVREKFVKALQEEFPDSGLVFSIGKIEGPLEADFTMQFSNSI